MKKIILALVCVICWAVAARGQMDTVSGPDGRVTEWCISYWYDTCAEYLDTVSFRPPAPTTGHCGNTCGRMYLMTIGGGFRNGTLLAKPECTIHPAALKGVGVWVDPYPRSSEAYWDSVSKLPEYIYVVQKGAGDTMIFLDSVRWDTAECRVLKVPLNVDSAAYGFRYCLLYTAYFDKPVEVDSVYYLAGSFYSNVIELNTAMHRKTAYAGAIVSRQIRNGLCRPIPYPTKYYYLPTYGNPNLRGTWGDYTSDMKGAFGFFMPHIDFVRMDVGVADSTMGSAGPSGEMSSNTTQTIWARPERGYRFSRWNDGDTNNPRLVRLMQDTAFTAYFTSDEPHTVSVSSNTPLGHVEGGGTYYLGEEVTLTAVTTVTNYRFVRWNDSLTENPRSFVLTSDTAFTAYFERKGAQGIVEPVGDGRFGLVPNPAYGSVTVTVGKMADGGVLALHDAAGRELWSGTLAKGEGERELDLTAYPPGVYFVTLTTGNGTEVQKLVLK